jgi:hypothetical protein
MRARKLTPKVLQTYYEQRKKIQPYRVIFSFSSFVLLALSAIFYKILNNVNTSYLLVGTYILFYNERRD